MKQQGLTEEVLNSSIADYEHSERFHERERAVLRFVDLLNERPEEARAQAYEKLRASLSEEEIVELLIYLVLNLGMHIVMSTIDIYPMFDPAGNLVSQEESRLIYGAVPGAISDGSAVKGV